MNMKRVFLCVGALVGVLVAQDFCAANFTNKTNKSVWVAANRNGVYPAKFLEIKKDKAFDVGSNRFLFVWLGRDNAFTNRYSLPVDAPTRLKKDAFGSFIFGYVDKKHNKNLTKPKKINRKPEILEGISSVKKAYKILNISVGQENTRPWKVLGIKKDASKRDAAKAYKKLSLKWHPDVYYRHEVEFKKDGITQDDVAEVFKILTAARENFEK